MGIKKVFNTYKEIPKDFEWIMEGDFLSEDESGLRLGPFSDGNAPRITFDNIENIYSYLKSGGECIINTSAIGHDDFISHSLKRYLGLERSSLNIEDLSNKNLKESNILKICDHFSIGEYTDIIAADAYLEKFNFVKIRNFLLKSMSYLSYLNKGNISFIPFDLEYGFCNSRFYLQLHANVQNFFKEYLLESFLPVDRDHPFKSLLIDSLKETDFLEIYHLESSEKIVMSSVWFKEAGLSNFFPSLIINNILGFEEVRDDLVQRPRIKTLKSISNIPSTDLPGHSARLIGGVSKNREDFFELKYIVEVIQRVRSGKEEGESTKPSHFEMDDLSDYELEFNKDLIPDLHQKQKEFIVNCLNDANEFNKLKANVDQMMGEFNANKYVEVITNNILNSTLDDIILYFKKNKNEENSHQLIQGTPEKIDDVWKVKRVQIIESFKENSRELILNNAIKEEFDKCIADVFSSELNCLESECRPYVDYLIGKSLSQVIEIDSDKDLASLELEFSRQMQKYENLLSEEKKKLENAMKLISIMKGQISGMAEVESRLKNKDSSSSDLTVQAQIDTLKMELKDAFLDIRNREKTIDKIRQSTDKLIKLKDEEIRDLIKNKKIKNDEIENDVFNKKQYEAIKEIIGESDPVEAIEKIKIENKKLNSQLEIMKTKLATINENIEKGNNEKVSKLENQVNKLKETNTDQFKTLSEIKVEKEKLNRELKIKKIELEKILSDKKSSIKEDPVKKNEDGEKLKEAISKIKSYEQKIKFLTAQLDGGNKSHSKAGGANAKKDGSKIKIKQLETLKLKAEEALKKGLKDLTGQKKENHTLKQELTSTKNKLQELERKSGKKAA